MWRIRGRASTPFEVWVDRDGFAASTCRPARDPDADADHLVFVPAIELVEGLERAGQRSFDAGFAAPDGAAAAPVGRFAGKTQILGLRGLT